MIILDAVSLSAGAIRGSPVFVDMIYGADIIPEQNDGVELEVSIDIGVSHAICPNILLVHKYVRNKFTDKTRSRVIRFL